MIIKIIIMCAARDAFECGGIGTTRFAQFAFVLARFYLFGPVLPVNPVNMFLMFAVKIKQ